MTRVLAALAGACLAAAACARDRGQPEPGMELYAVAPDSVREILLSSRDRKLYGVRWRGGEPFELLVAARGDSTRRCVAGDAFDRWLRAVSSLKVRGAVAHPFATESAEWADIQLRDASALEPITVRLRIPTGALEPVVVDVDGRQYAIEADPATLRPVRGGCAVLGSNSTR